MRLNFQFNQGFICVYLRIAETHLIQVIESENLQAPDIAHISLQNCNNACSTTMLV